MVKKQVETDKKELSVGGKTAIMQLKEENRRLIAKVVGLIGLSIVGDCEEATS